MECPDPACQTPEYPYSPGGLVEDAAPGRAEARAEIAERILDPFGYTVSRHQPGEQFGIRASIEIFLKGASRTGEKHRAGGWFGKHVADLEHEVEDLSMTSFLTGAREFLRDAGVKDVLLLSLGAKPITRAQATAPVLDNLDMMVSAALSEEIDSNEKPAEVILEAFGSNDQFELQVQLRFRPVHAARSPPIIVYVWALPHELMERSDESEFFYEDRVNEFLEDKARVKQLEAESRTKMEALVSSYEALMSQRFPVTKASHHIEVDLSDITV